MMPVPEMIFGGSLRVSGLLSPAGPSDTFQNNSHGSSSVTMCAPMPQIKTVLIGSRRSQAILEKMNRHSGSGKPVLTKVAAGKSHAYPVTTRQSALKNYPPIQEMGNLKLNQDSTQRLPAVSQQPSTTRNEPSRSLLGGGASVYQAISQLPAVPLEVNLQVQGFLREMEHRIRLKRQQVAQEKQAVKDIAQTLAETFDQKRKLKKAAKKILTSSMLQGLTAEEI